MANEDVDRQPPPMTTEGVDLGDMGGSRDEPAAAGRTAVLVAVDAVAGVLALADAPRDTAAAAVRASCTP